MNYFNSLATLFMLVAIYDIVAALMTRNRYCLESAVDGKLSPSIFTFRPVHLKSQWLSKGIFLWLGNFSAMISAALAAYIILHTLRGDLKELTELPSICIGIYLWLSLARIKRHMEHQLMLKILEKDLEPRRLIIDRTDHYLCKVSDLPKSLRRTNSIGLLLFIASAIFILTFN